MAPPQGWIPRQAAASAEPRLCFNTGHLPRIPVAIPLPLPLRSVGLTLNHANYAMPNHSITGGGKCA